MHSYTCGPQLAVAALTAEEELDGLCLQDLHEACQSAPSAGQSAGDRLPVDRQTSGEWHTVLSKLGSLAEEVRRTAPAQLFDAAAASEHQAPSPDVQQQQLECIIKVC